MRPHAPGPVIRDFELVKTPSLSRRQQAVPTPRQASAAALSWWLFEFIALVWAVKSDSSKPRQYLKRSLWERSLPLTSRGTKTQNETGNLISGQGRSLFYSTV